MASARALALDSRGSGAVFAAARVVPSVVVAEAVMRCWPWPFLPPGTGAPRTWLFMWRSITRKRYVYNVCEPGWRRRSRVEAEGWDLEKPRFIKEY